MNDKEKFLDFSLRLDRVIDGMRKNLNFANKNKTSMKKEFFEGCFTRIKT